MEEAIIVWCMDHYTSRRAARSGAPLATHATISKVIFSAPVAKILIVAGLTLLIVAAVGGVANKYEPGKAGRILAGLSAPVVLAIGLALQVQEIEPQTPPLIPTPGIPAPTTGAAVQWTVDQVQRFMNTCTITFRNQQPWCVCFLGKLQTRSTYQEVDAILLNGAFTNVFPPEYVRFQQECNLGR